MSLELLLVEDDGHCAEMLTDAVELALVDWKMHIVSTGAEALRALESSPPDIVLLDLRLPDMNGIDLLRSIRRSPVLRGLPILAWTASKSEEAVREIDGLAPLLSKPPGFLGLQRLVDGIEEAVRGSTMEPKPPEKPPILEDEFQVSKEEYKRLTGLLSDLRKESNAGVALTQRLTREAKGLAGECNIMRTSMSIEQAVEELDSERRDSEA